MNYFHISLIVFIVFFLLFKLYVKITYKFWAYQPVFHHYNLLYWLYPKGIIDSDLPQSNKFCNFLNISTKDFLAYDKNDLEEIVQLIRDNYHRNKLANYLPTVESFSSYFIGHSSKAYISIYYDHNFIMDGSNNTIIKDKKPIGVITGRPVNITLNGNTAFRAYYVDYLCVHKDHRNKDIAPQLIQTYEHAQRHDVKSSKVSLFKREGKLTGIVPLTFYKTYLFDIVHIAHNKLQQASMQLISINKLNIQVFIDFITNRRNKFDCFVLPDFSHLLNLINSNTYRIYGILENDALMACYCFRDSHMTYSQSGGKDTKGGVAVEFFAAINNCPDMDLFITGFSMALHKCSSELSANLVIIENISDTTFVVDSLLKNAVKAIFSSPTAYFYYNYAKRPLLSDKVFILS
jgi:ribosomal protein S18 acetylase RimI-like enzyme